jgi:hypothetical protein
METFEQFYSLDQSNETIEALDDLKNTIPSGLDHLSKIIRDSCSMANNQEALEKYTLSRMNKTIEDIAKTYPKPIIGLGILTAQQFLLFEIISLYYNMLNKYKKEFPNDFLRMEKIARTCYNVEYKSSNDEDMFEVIHDAFMTLTNLQDRNIVIKWCKAVYIFNSNIESDEDIKKLEEEYTKTLKEMFNSVPKAVLPNI